ncbi:MAG: hypoxanthine-guanine phosphoribosyltransferase [Gammaproteobacteria bacterium]
MSTPACGDNMEEVLGRAELIHPAQAVREALDAMAGQITEAMSDRDPILLAVMTGGMVPAVHLSSRLKFPHRLDYVHATRYESGIRGGRLEWRARPHLELAENSVLIVDDILDEGITMSAIIDYCRHAGARDVRTAVLVEKHHTRHRTGVSPDFSGLQVPDRYVFGCGMDYREYFRHLPAIYALATEQENQG